MQLQRRNCAAKPDFLQLLYTRYVPAAGRLQIRRSHDRRSHEGKNNSTYLQYSTREIEIEIERVVLNFCFAI
jgi:hypothetical protein